MEELFQEHLEELRTLGLIGPKHIEIAKRMDRAADELYADEVEFYLRREPNPEGHRKTLGKYGLLGIQVPQANGGLGGDALALALAFERLGQVGMGPVTFLDVQCCLTETILNRWGNKGQKREYLTPAARGKKIIAYCLTEPEAGSDPASLSTEFEEAKDGYRITGTKYLITNGSIADAYIVFAYPKGKREGMSAFLVDRDEKTVKVDMRLKEKVGLFTSDTTLLEFNRAFSPKENLIGESGRGLHVAYTGLLSGRVGIAAGCVGVIEDCLNSATERAKSRVQHGKLIGKHQLIQRRIAAIAEHLETARWPVYAAASWKAKHDLRPDDQELRKLADHRSTIAKVIATRAAWEASDHALQVFGGFGYSILSAPGRHYIDVRATRIYEGADEVLELKIASDVLGKEFEAYK